MVFDLFKKKKKRENAQIGRWKTHLPNYWWESEHGSLSWRCLFGFPITCRNMAANNNNNRGVDREKGPKCEKKNHITKPIINLPGCTLPYLSRFPVCNLYFSVLLQPSHGMLLLSPFTDKTSAVYTRSSLFSHDCSQASCESWESKSLCMWATTHPAHMQQNIRGRKKSDRKCQQGT